MSVPLPPDLCIVLPGTDVDPALARFSGTWGNGAWGGIAPTALAVERVDPEGAATVAYSFGACPQYGMADSWERRSDRIADGRLTLDGQRGVTTAFALGPDDVLVDRFVPGAVARRRALLVPRAGRARDGSGRPDAAHCRAEHRRPLRFRGSPQG